MASAIVGRRGQAIVGRLVRRSAETQDGRGVSGDGTCRRSSPIGWGATIILANSASPISSPPIATPSGPLTLVKPARVGCPDQAGPPRALGCADVAISASLQQRLGLIAHLSELAGPGIHV